MKRRRFSQETEETLSLYLDGLLPAHERASFERRIEGDPDLRHAVEFHRGLSLEFHEEAPPLPRGYAGRAAARLEKAREAGGAMASRGDARAPGRAAAERPWWRSPLALASACALAVVVAVVALAGRGHFFTARPPVRVAANAPQAEADSGRSANELKDEKAADEETIQALRSLGYLSSGRPAATPQRKSDAAPRAKVAGGRKATGTATAPVAPPAPASGMIATTRTESKTGADKTGMEAARSEEETARSEPAAKESLTAKQAIDALAQATPETAKPAAAGSAPQAAPEAAPTLAPEVAMTPAPADAIKPAPETADTPAVSRDAKLGAAVGGAADAVSFRVARLAKAPEPGREPLVIRSSEAWGAFAGEGGPASPLASFETEMAIVLRDDLGRDPPARLRVVGVRIEKDRIVVTCRAEPRDGSDSEAVPGQAVIVPASDRPVRLVTN